MDPRLARSHPEPDRPYPPGESEFRTDLERIRFASALSRLADVTQVVTSMATSGVVHNRLTHTIKVSAVARAIAVRLLRTQWSRRQRLHMILAILRSVIWVSGSLIDWRG